MKKVLLFILAVVTILVVGCGYKTVSRHSGFEWPEGELARLLPVPTSKIGVVSTNTEVEFKVEIGHTKSKQFNEYVEKCQELGFTVDSSGSNTSYRYSAYNNSRYHLDVLHNDSYDYMTITIKVPIGSREFQWPNSEIAKLIPTPKSNMGSIEWENSSGFLIYVGNTSKAEYDIYVNACVDNGFTVDYRKGDEHYYANNEAGYSLSLNYEGADVMRIRIEGPIEETSAEPAPSSEQPSISPSSAPPPTPPSSDPVISNDPTPPPAPTADTLNWREFLAEYEAWMDKYIEVLEKFNRNPTDFPILMDYMEMMEELIEWTEKAEQFEDELEGNEEALREFLAIQMRILEKLSTIE